FASEPPSGVELTTLELPVRGRVSFELLVPALEGGDFDGWLGLGQAGGRAHLSVERLGINVLARRETSDEAGSAASEERLGEDGPAAYFSRLPVVRLAEHITAAGTPAAVSNSAGTYICNELIYVVQHHLASAGRELPSGFIHLPYLPEQLADKPPATPSMALETQLLGVRAAVEFVRDLAASPVAAAGRAGATHD
ncbi:MAG: pyroglutamyl-peptidase I, partial [Dehalococcoidia bacterium]